MKGFVPLMLALAAGSVLSACEEERAAAPPPLPAKKAPPKAEAAPAATPGPAYVYFYNPKEKRDPFRSPIDEEVGPVGPATLCNEPLCQFDLDQLTLVAVVTGDANPIAMVEDPQGRGFIVRRSTKMGKQGGKVTSILRDSVTVTELYTTPDGKVNANPVVMNLKADKQVQPIMDLATGKSVQ